MEKRDLPYFQERGVPIDMLVIHASAYDPETMIYHMHEYKVSAHYILDEKGALWQLVAPELAAQHAGPGFWRGEERSVNQRSVGIELCSPSLGQKAYPAVQIAALIRLMRQLVQQYQIPAVNLVGHSDVAPLRKPDPGRAFPWKALAEAGLGYWYDWQDADKMKTEDPAELLALIGYDTRDVERVKASAYAFCRRFLPRYVKTDEDVLHLVDHVGPENYDFMARKDFLQTLKAVAYRYQK